MKLFAPIKVGQCDLSHRIVLAPLTRFRADRDVPCEQAITYYAQRASVPGTLLITEATFISTQAGGYANVPGIYNDEQIAAWRRITDAVHEKKSFIYCQLWYLGRAAVRKVLAEYGHDVRTSGTIPLNSAVRPMSVEEIQEAVKQYAQAAKNAIAAGFDGVEIHGANGYLIDQFLQDTCNNRTDEYGGSIENRVRFPLQVVNAVVNAIGSDRVGLRMSPWSPFQGMKMKDPKPTFIHYLERLPKLAYLHATEARVAGGVDNAGNESLDFIRDRWNGVFIVAGGYTLESAKVAAESGALVAIGRYFISNPDLVARYKLDVPLKKYNRDTFYSPGEEGYTTYEVDQELINRSNL